MKKIINVQVEKQPGEKSFACYMIEDMEGFGLSGYGKSVRDAMRDLYVSMDETKEIFNEQGKEFPELDIKFHFDIGSLFDYYSFLSIAGVAKRAGINASLMRQYASGVHKPSIRRRSAIIQSIHEIGKELQSVVQ